jgi:hypothetical protein
MPRGYEGNVEAKALDNAAATMELELITMKFLLVTGASRGIGAACAVLATSCGFKVCINYRREVSKRGDAGS